MFKWETLAEWEKRLVSIARQCIKKYPIGIHYLYITLSNMAANWIAENKYGIFDGAQLLIPMEDGNQLKFTFYRKTTQLELVNQNTGKSDVFISSESSARKEYRDIQTLERYINVSGTKLGYAPTEEWIEFLQQIKVGDTITFEGAHTYCCLKAKNGVLSLIETFTGNPENITAKTFDSIEIIKVNIFSPMERKLLFSKNKYDVMGIAVPTVTEGTFAQQELNRLVHELQKRQTKVMHWGPINVSVRKNITNDGFVWYVNGKKTNEILIKMMLGYFNNGPMSTEFIRDSHDTLTDFEDYDCLNKVKAFCAIAKYANAFDTICAHVLEYKQDVSVNLKTFKPDEYGNYIATCFAFKYEKDQVQVYQIDYEDNDFKKDISKYQLVDEAKFIEVCELINRHNRAFWFNEIFEKYHLSCPTETQARIINNTLDLKTQKNPIINEVNFKQYITLDSLLDSYNNNNNKEENINANNKIFQIFDAER